jgi:hypothetical protein
MPLKAPPGRLHCSARVRTHPTTADASAHQAVAPGTSTAKYLQTGGQKEGPGLKVPSSKFKAQSSTTLATASASFILPLLDPILPASAPASAPAPESPPPSIRITSSYDCYLYQLCTNYLSTNLSLSFQIDPKRMSRHLLVPSLRHNERGKRRKQHDAFYSSSSASKAIFPISVSL